MSHGSLLCKTYGLAGILCLMAPFVYAEEALIEPNLRVQFTLVALPLALMSWALGVAHSQLGTRGVLGWLAALVWGLAACAISVPVVVMREQMTTLGKAELGLVAGASCLLVVTCIKILMSGGEQRIGALLGRSLQAGGCMLVALLFGRWSLAPFIVIRLSRDTGVRALAAEATLFAGVVSLASVLLLSGTILSRWRVRSRAQ